MKAIVFEQHAVERYIERFAPGTPLPKALRDLQTKAAAARCLRQRRPDGKFTYEADDGMQLVVAFERGARICVTVLPAGADEGYVHEQRVTQPSAIDPATEALRLAVSYVLERSMVDPIARTVRARIEAVAPWALSPAIAEAANDGGSSG